LSVDFLAMGGLRVGDFEQHVGVTRLIERAEASEIFTAQFGADGFDCWWRSDYETRADLKKFLVITESDSAFHADKLFAFTWRINPLAKCLDGSLLPTKAIATTTIRNREPAAT
jgi:hypothetical protein